ncbi:MAG TPA: ABC transporter permease [Candidatus Limnocylindrales bacterium]|nr:ABC transporter permease [Candidatus Limnocylindrales bacterium]
MSVRTLLWNPIVAKEYRSRMRTIRSPLAMTLYVLALGGLGWAVFSNLASSASIGQGGGAGSYGQSLFIFLIFFQMVLLTFITPALTSAAISGERERQTIDLLFCTRVPPFSILWGKLLASMSFVILLLVVSVPIFSLVFLFGGIEADQVLMAFAVTAMSALALGAIGIFFSTLMRRTLASTVLSYAAAFTLVFATLGWGLLFPTEVTPLSTQAPAPPAVTYASPLFGLSWIAGQGFGGQYGVRYAAGGAAAVTSVAVPGKGVATPAISTVYPPIVTTTSGSKIPSGLFAGWDYWQATIALQVAITLVALAVSAYLLPPIRRVPWRRKPAGAGVAGADAHA